MASMVKRIGAVMVESVFRGSDQRHDGMLWTTAEVAKFCSEVLNHDDSVWDGYKF